MSQASSKSTVTLKLLSGESKIVELKDKLFWKYLKEDLVPAIPGVSLTTFGKWTNACVSIRNNDLHVVFDNQMRNERVLDKIPSGSTLYCLVWLAPGSSNWRTDMIGNACDVALLDPEDKCAICLEEWNTSKWMLECGHIFHKECVAKAQGTQYPLCRSTRTASEKKWALM